MIFLWLKFLLNAVLRLFIPPPPAPEPEPRINKNAPCPACGHRRGTLLFKRVGPANKPVVGHSCLICKCAWYEEPVGKPEMPGL